MAQEVEELTASRRNLFAESTGGSRRNLLADSGNADQLRASRHNQGDGGKEELGAVPEDEEETDAFEIEIPMPVEPKEDQRRSTSREPGRRSRSRSSTRSAMSNVRERSLQRNLSGKGSDHTPRPGMRRKDALSSSRHTKEANGEEKPGTDSQDIDNTRHSGSSLHSTEKSPKSGRSSSRRPERRHPPSSRDLSRSRSVDRPPVSSGDSKARRSKSREGDVLTSSDDRRRSRSSDAKKTGPSTSSAEQSRARRASRERRRIRSEGGVVKRSSQYSGEMGSVPKDNSEQQTSAKDTVAVTPPCQESKCENSPSNLEGKKEIANTEKSPAGSRKSDKTEMKRSTEQSPKGSNHVSRRRSGSRDATRSRRSNANTESSDKPRTHSRERPRTSRGESRDPATRHKSVERTRSKRSSSRDGRIISSSERAPKTSGSPRSRTRSASREHRTRRHASAAQSTPSSESNDAKTVLSQVEEEDAEKQDTPVTTKEAKQDSSRETPTNHDPKPKSDMATMISPDAKQVEKDDKTPQNATITPDAPRQRPEVVFRDKENDEKDKKNDDGDADIVIDVNPAFALLCHLGLDGEKDEAKQDMADPYVALLKSCVEEGPAVEESKKLHHRELTKMDKDQRSTKKEQKSGELALPETPEVTESKVPSNKGMVTSSKKDMTPSTRRSAQSKESKPVGSNAATDLLGFLGSAYGELQTDSQTQNATPSDEDLGLGDNAKSSVEFFQGRGGQSDPSSANFVVNRAPTGFGEISGSCSMNESFAPVDNFMDSFSAGMQVHQTSFAFGGKTSRPKTKSAASATPCMAIAEEGSVAHSTIADRDKQMARRARRLARTSKKKTEEVSTKGTEKQGFATLDEFVSKGNDKKGQSLNPPSLAGDMVAKQSRRVQLSSIEAPNSPLNPPSMAGDAIASNANESGKVVRRGKKGGTKASKIVFRGGSKSGQDDECEASLAPPSICGTAVQHNVMTVKTPIEETQEGEESPVDEDMPRKVTRSEVRKAKKFAMLGDDDEDDDDEFSLEGEQTEFVQEKKGGFRRGMLSKAQSAVNVLERTTKKVAKKAASTRNLFA